MAEVMSDNDDNGVEDEDTDAAIEKPFNPEDIDITTRSTTVNLLLSRLRTGRLDLEPEFQRGRVWNPRRKSRLIESLLLNIPLPTIYAAESKEGEDSWIIVDGVQRLSTIASFVYPNLFPDPEIQVLTDLEYLTGYEGLHYSELNERLRTRIDETEFVVNLIRRGTPEEVMFNIFARINTGGAPLTRQELRHALTPGPGRVILKDLAASDDFRLATGGRVKDDRMEAREMVLRFIAFNTKGVESYDASTDFDGFLSSAMRDLSGLSEAKQKALRRTFTACLTSASEIFGDHAFRKSLPGDDRRAPINKALFETVMSALGALSAADRKRLAAKRTRILKQFGLLLADEDFRASISQGTGDSRKVHLRHSEVRRVLAP